MRIYQGSFIKGGTYYNQRTGRKERFSRIVRMPPNSTKRSGSDSPGRALLNIVFFRTTIAPPQIIPLHAPPKPRQI